MSSFKADLHTHSTISDGTVSPKDLVDLAIEKGLQGLSITDHDAVDAYQEASEYAKEKGLLLIPGVEISAEHRGEGVHILGYAYNPNSTVLKDFCNHHRERRMVRNRAILAKLRENGVPIEESEFIDPQSETITYGRPHIALAMVRRGYVADVQEAFRKYLGSERSCYVPGDRWTVDQAIAAIHEAEGLAVIAHPHLITRPRVVREILQKPFDGIEVYYSRFPRNVCDRWGRIADEKKWLKTGGSDFHGSVKPEVNLGVSFVSQEDFTPIWNHFQR